MHTCFCYWLNIRFVIDVFVLFAWCGDCRVFCSYVIILVDFVVVLVRGDGVGGCLSSGFVVGGDGGGRLMRSLLVRRSYLAVFFLCRMLLCCFQCVRSAVLFDCVVVFGYRGLR